MKICVTGLWHLGTVTAGCLAAASHQVVGLDLDSAVVGNLKQGKPPLYEPGLEDLLRAGLAAGRLSFTTDEAAALRDADLVWVTYDTPVDDSDAADVGYVMDRVERLFPHLAAGTCVLISSQLPVGSTRALESRYRSAFPAGGASFAYSPENLRLGRAIAAFTDAERVIAGTRSDRDRKLLGDLFARFCGRVEWMSVESAEMTKHALNAFLATSVAFINEIAVICEDVGADAKEVERGLKSEGRIGPRAYLSPGGAFAGGTLARDLMFLSGLGAEHGFDPLLLRSVRASNDAHRQWERRKIQALLKDLRGKNIAIWGLAYKVGTDTLRRSTAVELAAWIGTQGGRVQAHDWAVKALPPEVLSMGLSMELFGSPLAALRGADALVVSTAWPEYRKTTAEEVASAMTNPLILDVGGFLAENLEGKPGIHYYKVGKSQ